MDLTRSNLLEAYRVMTLIRAFEERLHLEFATGEIPGFVHLYAGEEESPPASACCSTSGTKLPAPTGDMGTVWRKAAMFTE